MEVSKDNLAIAQFLAKAIGKSPHVYPYWDEKNQTSIDVLDLEDPLDWNLKFYCSIGLSAFSNEIEMKDGVQNMPVELIIGAYQDFQKLPNLLASCCFYVIKNSWTIQPGSVFKDLVADYYPESEMKHLLFTRPYPWMDKLNAYKSESRSVNWVWMVPISESELEVKLKNGVDYLVNLLMEQEDRLFDIDRAPVV